MGGHLATDFPPLRPLYVPLLSLLCESQLQSLPIVDQLQIAINGGLID